MAPDLDSQSGYKNTKIKLAVSTGENFMKLQSNAVDGFTLIEMIMVLSIAAILMTIAVPSYNTFAKNSKLTKQVNLLAATVSLARSEAAKRGARVTVCQSNSPTADDPDCNGTAGTWSNGWVVFIDADSDGAHDTGEIVVSRFQPETEIIIKTDVGTSLTFNPDGTTTSGPQEFAVCDDRGVSKGKQLSVSGTGRPSTGAAQTCTPA